jgi:fermentation-respiration switch protein FrsA (DUF1100 family)
MKGIVAMLLVPFVLVSCQSILVFPRGMARNRVNIDQFGALREVTLGESFGWYFEPFPGAPKRVVMMFHGNAETVDDFATWAGEIARKGVSVLLVEFPGYREAMGKAGQRSIAKVSSAAYDWLLKSGYAAGEIIVFGRSVGAGAACDLTRKREVKKLVLVSAFTSLGDAAKYAGFPKVAGLGRFNNLSAIAKYRGDLLVVHGGRDEMLPVEMGQLLFEKAGTAAEGKRLVVLDAGHNDLIFKHEAEVTALILQLAAKE